MRFPPFGFFVLFICFCVFLYLVYAWFMCVFMWVFFERYCAPPPHSNTRIIFTPDLSTNNFDMFFYKFSDVFVEKCTFPELMKFVNIVFGFRQQIYCDLDVCEEHSHALDRGGEAIRKRVGSNLGCLKLPEVEFCVPVSWPSPPPRGCAGCCGRAARGISHPV